MTALYFVQRFSNYRKLCRKNIVLLLCGRMSGHRPHIIRKYILTRGNKVHSISLCRYYLRSIFASYPLPLSGICASMMLGLGFLCMLISVRQQLGELHDESVQLSKVGAVAEVPALPRTLPVPLPPMRSSAIVSKFNGIAADMNVVFDEAAYSLEATDQVPYLRYRITLTTQAGYGDIRRFLAALSSELPNATLDRIRCARQDAAQPVLGCELAFTAFFSET